MAERLAWVAGLAGLLVWVVTGRWPFAVAGVAVAVGTLFTTTWRKDRREDAEDAGRAGDDPDASAEGAGR
jgi:hypothetical protein